jgi:hypothetical protein
MRLFSLSVAAVLFSFLPANAADTYVTFVHKDTKKVLAVADGSSEGGAKVILAKENATDESQHWKLEKDGEMLKIVNRKSGKVLDVNEVSNDEGASLIIWDSKDDGNDNQRFKWDEKAGTLVGKASGHALDVDKDGFVIQKKLDKDAKGQAWEAKPVK